MAILKKTTVVAKPATKKMAEMPIKKVSAMKASTAASPKLKQSASAVKFDKLSTSAYNNDMKANRFAEKRQKLSKEVGVSNPAVSALSDSVSKYRSKAAVDRKEMMNTPSRRNPNYTKK